MRKFLFTLAVAASLHAATIFEGSGKDTDGLISATAIFTIKCDATSCRLDIILENNIPNPKSAAQLVSAI